MNIRLAEEKDKAIWSKFRSKLWPGSFDDHLSEIEDFFKGQSIDIDLVFIAELSDCTPVGFIEVNLRDYAEGSRCSPIPYIEAWFVMSDQRGKGIGKALVQAAESWAIDNGYSEIASDTTLDNQNSINAHKHLGYTEVERVVCFLKSLKNV